jgi:hypothetical protein
VTVYARRRLAEICCGVAVADGAGDRGSRVAGWGYLGDERYEALARAGETMTNAAMATYALDQIDQARAELNAVSK